MLQILHTKKYSKLCTCNCKEGLSPTSSFTYGKHVPYMNNSIFSNVQCNIIDEWSWCTVDYFIHILNCVDHRVTTSMGISFHLAECIYGEDDVIKMYMLPCCMADTCSSNGQKRNPKLVILITCFYQQTPLEHLTVWFAKAD